MNKSEDQDQSWKEQAGQGRPRAESTGLAVGHMQTVHLNEEMWLSHFA